MGNEAKLKRTDCLGVFISVLPVLAKKPMSISS